MGGRKWTSILAIANALPSLEPNVRIWNCVPLAGV
jgi:hypothetical protein